MLPLMLAEHVPVGCRDLVVEQIALPAYKSYMLDPPQFNSPSVIQSSKCVAFRGTCQLAISTLHHAINAVTL